MTHQWSKTWILWLVSTRLVIIIIVQNIGIQLKVELNIGPQFNLLLDPEYWPNIEYFSNNKVRSSYLPKLDPHSITWSLIISEINRNKCVLTQPSAVSLKNACHSDFVSARSLVSSMSSNLEADKGPSGGNDVHVGVPVTVITTVADLGV